MKRRASPTSPRPDDARFDLTVGRGRLSVVGLATAVIALVAVLGLVYVAAKAVGVAERVVEQVAPAASGPPSGEISR